MTSFRRFVIIKLIILLLIAKFSVQEVFAATYTYSQNNLDIMFVVDCSNSMNANDKNKMALQMIGALIDTSFSTKTRVGYTAYNHTILSSERPKEIDTKAKRDNLRRHITQITRSGSTDIGLALKHAFSLLDTKGKTKSIIILISDGETDLTYADTGRTKDNSDKDSVEVAEECSKRKIPIYTIAFSDSYDGNPESLSQLSSLTKAAFYQAPAPEDLINIFNEIVKKDIMSSIIPIGASLSNGKMQSISIPLKNNEEICEANILVVSTSPIEEANLFYSGKDISFHRSQYYFTGKILNPSSDKATLQIRSSAEKDIRIYLQLYQDVDFKVNIPDKIEKNIPFNFQAYFYDNLTKKKITKKSFYQDFRSNVIFYRLNNQNKINKSFKKQKITDISLKEGGLKGTTKITKSGNYKLNYYLTSNLYSLILADIPIKVINNVPEGNFEKNLLYSTQIKEKVFDLNQYFFDKNQDKLTYQVTELEGNNIEFLLEENKLTLKLKTPGVSSFQIKATDEEGKEVISSKTEVTVQPLWRYYIEVTVMIIVVIFVLILIFIFLWIRKQQKKPKPYFSGKLNLYFTKVPDEMEIEPLTFTLYSLEAKEISLEELLDGAKISIPELDAGKIKFLPSFERKIIFCHYSACNIMIGSSIACNKLKYSIEYGNKIYMTSKDEEYELEIHYMSAKV